MFSFHPQLNVDSFKTLEKEFSECLQIWTEDTGKDAAQDLWMKSNFSHFDLPTLSQSEFYFLSFSFEKCMYLKVSYLALKYQVVSLAYLLLNFLSFQPATKLDPWCCYMDVQKW